MVVLDAPEAEVRVSVPLSSASDESMRINPGMLQRLPSITSLCGTQHTSKIAQKNCELYLKNHGQSHREDETEPTLGDFQGRKPCEKMVFHHKQPDGGGDESR